MQGSIFDIKRYSVHDGPGIRSTVFLKGCPLKCPWCHNPEGIEMDKRLMFNPESCIGNEICKIESCPGKDKLSEIKGKKQSEIMNDSFVENCPCSAVEWDCYFLSSEEIVEEIMKDMEYYKISGGGVTISGGEPTMQPAFLLMLLKELKQKGLHTVLDTCACVEWDLLEKLSLYIDLFLVDIKIIDAFKHESVCGSNNDMILSNIQKLCAAGKNIILRVPIIPEYTDSYENLDKIISFVKRLDSTPSIELLPYHSLGASKYERLGMINPCEKTVLYTHDELERIKNLFTANGINVSIQHYATPRKMNLLSSRNTRLLKTALEMKDSRIPWERSVWYTRGFKQTAESEPQIIRRAKALKNVLENSKIEIRDDELIVGEQLRTLQDGNGISIEYGWIKGITSPETWLTIDKEHIPPQVSKELMWWNDKNLNNVVSQKMRDGVIHSLIEEGVFEGPKYYFGHNLPDIERALKIGYGKIRVEALKCIQNLDPQCEGYIERMDFYNAVVLCCEGVISLGKRYRDLAFQLAEDTKDIQRKAELFEIANVFERIPEYPPQTFREALQMTWIVHYLNEEEMPAVNTQSFGRLDQFLYQYYKHDLSIGTITKEEAIELLEAFFIKCYRTFEEQHTMLGGVKPDGSDGVNELTFLCLEAVKNLRIPKAIGVRIDSKSSDEYLEKILEVLEEGMGVPSIYNDEVIINALTERGLKAESARNYAVTGCIELAVPGEAEFWTVGAFINATKILELCLNNGCSMTTGKKLVPEFPPYSSMQTYEQLLNVFKDQMNYVIEKVCNSQFKAEELIGECQPMPLFSSLMKPCMEKGVDTTRGGADYNFTGICLSDVASTANAIVAIKKIVFDEKNFSLNEYIQILKNNFEGNEGFRQYILNRAPKFGNDNKEVDEIAAALISDFDCILSKQPHARNGAFIPLVFSRPQRQSMFGAKTGASPDGRKAGKLLAVSLNPVNGTVSKGITATFNSQNHLPLNRLAGGISNNLDIHPSILMGDGRPKFAALLKGWCKTGGMEVALQIMDAATLKKAQESPEEYKDLSVRVYGFSEFFVKLNKNTQDYIISRADIDK